MPKVNIARSGQSRMEVLRSLASAGVFVALVASIGSVSALAADAYPQFNLVAPAIGPFTSGQFTIPDRSQITGRQVALPKPDCSKQPSHCKDIATINTLDSFNLQPRSTISFDAGINQSSVTSKGALLVEFGTCTTPRIIELDQFDHPSLSRRGGYL